MFLVGLSIAMLLAAPLLAAALLRRPALAAGLDGFVLVAVGGIVALHVVPQSASLAGPFAILVAALGLFLPIALHRLDDAVLAKSTARRARDVALFVVFLAGVLVHAIFDGAALTAEASSSSDALAAGVILHRVPVGVALWVVARPKLGTTRTVVVVAVYASGTVAGSVIGNALLAHASAPALAMFQAFVAGSILHIVAESPALPLPRVRPASLLLRGAPLRTPPPSKTVRAASLVGSVVAAVVLWLTERAHQGASDVADSEHAHAHAHAHATAASHGFVDALLEIALMCAPAALLSFVVVGVLYALLPAAPAPLLKKRARPSNAWLDAMRGTAAGLPHPLCSCAVAPLYDELVDDDAPAAGARAFLVAAPALGVPAVFLSARLLGLPFTGLRVAGAALLAVAAGWSAMLARSNARDGQDARRTPSARAPSARAPEARAPEARVPEARATPAQRLVHGLRHGVVDAVDHIGPWLLVGAAVAAAIDVYVGPAALLDVAAPTQIGLAALAALPLYLCAAGITPIAFALLGKGASAGAVLAFMLVGPTTSLPTFALVKRHHGAGAAVAFAVVVAVVAAVAGLAVDTFALAARFEVAAVQGPVTIVQMVSLALLATLLGASFVRQGVRGFLVQVMSPQHAHAGDDAHGPHCDHDHGPALAPPPVVRISVPFDPRGQS